MRVIIRLTPSQARTAFYVGCGLAVVAGWLPITLWWILPRLIG